MKRLPIHQQRPVVMALNPRSVQHYHVFLASPGDVGAERKAVRRFFDEYNRSTAHIWNVRFEVVDWENYATIGVGRPQELITQQTLEKYQDSLALVIGIMGQRFGSPSGKAESGTAEEFDWAMQSHKATGFPEIKWFFRKIDQLTMPSDPQKAMEALQQWQKVLAFRQRMQDLNDPVFYTEYPGEAGFADVFERDLNHWLADPARPWAAELAKLREAGGAPAAPPLPAEFDGQGYRDALLKQFDRLNFEMLDTTGAFYSGVRLWSVFVPQSVRETHQYNPRLLEIPKEHQKRLLDAGEITAEELSKAEQQADLMRQEYFGQPLRPVLEVVDAALRTGSAQTRRKLVILGDPGSGKSSLIRYLALRWARIAEPAVRDTQPIPLVIDLGAYGRWQCEGRKGFVRYLEEAPVWHEWPRGLLDGLLREPGRAVLLLDGLDEIFDVSIREAVINDIQRFSSEFAQTPILLTSRVVGYQPARLRDAEFQHFMLQDLDPEQITTFVDRWHEETFDDPAQAAPKRERLQKAIRESKSIAMLAGNPLLLTMMAILNRNQELPRDRADLYEQASRVLLHQWDTERALVDFPGMNANVGLREKRDILRRVAAHMQAGPGGLKGNMIDGAALIRLIEDYLQDELHFAQSRAAARTVVEHLRQRNFILCFVGADSYSFVHRTFLEYFCAADFVQQFNVSKTLDIDGLIALFDEHCQQDEWREVLRLICGQIDEVFVGQIVEHLATRTDLGEWDGETSLPEFPLAIVCLSEVRTTSKVEEAGGLLFRTIMDIFRKPYAVPDEDFLDALVAAASEIGVRWPGETNPPANPGLPSEPSLNHVYWPIFLAEIAKDRTPIQNLVSSNQWAVRWGAIEALSKKWPDQTTRRLLAKCAILDEDKGPRRAALSALAKKWPDKSTRQLLAQRAIQDPSSDVRGEVCTRLGKMHSELGRILLTRDLDGMGPFLDPLESISRNHIEKAAKKAGIPPDEIDAQVASLSAHLGWNITRGAKG